MKGKTMSEKKNAKTGAGSGVEVTTTTTTGGSFQPGDTVEHVDDPGRVHGKVLRVRDGMVEVEGFANRMPAVKLRKR